MRPRHSSADWDFGRIEQLLANLLTNSLRYTDAPGVNTADMRELFEPLFRGDKARQRGDQHGSGLGLSIARSIAHAHQGTISASMSQRGGLQLCVRLPVQPAMVTDKGTA